MLQKNTSASIETVLMKLTFKQKNFIYTIARLEYRIWNALTKLEIVNNLIAEEQDNITSINAALTASRKGKVTDKLMAWKIKAEYKLFKLNLRKTKIDVVKIVINQSKLEQTKQSLIALEKDIAEVEKKQLKLNVPINVEIIKNVFSIENLKASDYKVVNQNKLILESIDKYVRDYLKMAS